MDTKNLIGLGVPEKVAKVYLAGLSLGTTSVQELARASGLKRPTVYLYVDDLVERGLFEIIPINKKRYYATVDPRVVEERLKKSLADFQSELPKLTAMRSDTLGKPQVRVFEGIGGVRQIYEELKRAHSLRFWSNISEVYTQLNESFAEVSEAVRANGTTAREIIADNKESRRYSRFTAKIAGPTYSARTATVGGLENDAVIFGNVVVLFRLQGLNIFAVRIEDKTIADSMKAMFDMAWKTARPFK
ncbi:MAG: helix-turn-helix domain-containing protein [Patescibacteria group bacterium]